MAVGEVLVARAAIDEAAVRSIQDERIDWRFKGMPDSAFGTTISDFVRESPSVFDSGFVGPLLVLDEHALEHNLRTMADWCAQHGVHLAPHGKTTMAPQLFRRQLEHGSWAITAATLSQLRVYRAFGLQRVLFANQLVDPTGLRWLAGQLDNDPNFEFSCWVDSTRGVALMEQALREADAVRPVDVLLELGNAHGRTGVRTDSEVDEVVAAVAASPYVRLAGVAGYEGALAHDLSEHDVSAVDAYMARLRDVVCRLADAGYFAGLAEVIVTCGGSAYFDQVAQALTQTWPDGLTVNPVIRSGAYVTHDDGLYRTMSPFGREHRLSAPAAPFQPAMRVWAQVVSHPEPHLALLTMGRRDVSFDQHLPEPQTVRSTAGHQRELTGCQLTELADQHAFLQLEQEDDVHIGDWVAFGLSHPCTVFDKWSLIPVADDQGTVVDLVRTYF